MTNDIDSRSDRIIDLDAEEVTGQPRKDDAVQPSAKPAPARKGSLPLVAAALFAGIIGGGFLYRDVLATYLPSDQWRLFEEKLAALKTENSALHDRLASLDKLSAQIKKDVDALDAKTESFVHIATTAQSAGSSASEKIASVEQALAETRKTVAALTIRPAVSEAITPAPDEGQLLALSQRIEALENEVARLKATPPAPADNSAALFRALAELKSKIQQGAGYQDALTALQTLVPAAAGLDQLQQHASSGVAPIHGLASELKAIIRDLSHPIIPEPVPETEGWWAALYNSLSELIIIRVEGDVDWPTAAAAALALTESGDVSQALDQFTGIEAEKPVAIRQWMERAQARLDAERALKQVEEAVLRVIAAKG